MAKYGLKVLKLVHPRTFLGPIYISDISGGVDNDERQPCYVPFSHTEVIRDPNKGLSVVTHKDVPGYVELSLTDSVIMSYAYGDIRGYLERGMLIPEFEGEDEDEEVPEVPEDPEPEVPEDPEEEP